MSGIFRIFSETENSNTVSVNKGHVKQIQSLALTKKASETIKPITSKLATSSINKPKGLSIRSKSDLNVSMAQTSLGINKFQSKDALKINDKLSIKKKHSPIKLLKSPQKKINTTVKRLSPKVSPIRHNVTEDFVFTKPTTPKNVKKVLKYPEPETLAGDFNIKNYMEEEVRLDMEEDLAWLRSIRKDDDSIISVEDEGFISDYNSFETSNSTLLSPQTNMSDVELPAISDSDED